MAFKLLNGKDVAKKIRNTLKSEIEKLKKKPNLTVVLVGNNPASLIYVKNKEKYANEVGMKSEVIKLPENTTEEKLLKLIKKLNKDKKVNGILVQLPLPKQINEFNIINAISPLKDVDGFTVENKGLLSIGKPNLVPCTPLGILELLKFYNIKIEGKNVVVVGRSNIVGKPISQLLLNENATVITCHSYTKNLKDITTKADILISAVGKENLITKNHVKENSVVIDVAMIRDVKNNCWKGDVKFNEVAPKTKFITPVPGGIGPMTIAMLLQNTLTAYKKQNKK